MRSLIYLSLSNDFTSFSSFQMPRAAMMYPISIAKTKTADKETLPDNFLISVKYIINSNIESIIPAMQSFNCSFLSLYRKMVIRDKAREIPVKTSKKKLLPPSRIAFSVRFFTPSLVPEKKGSL